MGGKAPNHSTMKHHFITGQVFCFFFSEVGIARVKFIGFQFINLSQQLF